MQIGAPTFGFQWCSVSNNLLSQSFNTVAFILWPFIGLTLW